MCFIIVINKSGVMIRMQVEAMRVMGRATQGVRLINLKEDDQMPIKLALQNILIVLDLQLNIIELQ